MYKEEDTILEGNEERGIGVFEKYCEQYRVRTAWVLKSSSVICILLSRLV